ncbi:hypothetical protein GCM10010169_33980 [Micromonospora fulviviridis]|uniref:toll/interleukin-1 receptor domain-containing protein n=1 Tax=Micromonospora fulviviridis TaxID=47860 RepID=UPI001669641A|nr:toll/interleukin-1 receptor domain-containing protein [Micromonospora fulviviridis]GGR86953.1 hypothetical protein GCM10010169_33980 [Micromonospora fulviviridis]
MPHGSARRYDIFVSYASVDRERVESFVRQLEADNFQVYFDRNDVIELRPLPLQLAEALDASAHVLLCLTPAYMRGPWAGFEAQNAFAADPAGLGGRIVPVWLERADAELPAYLRQLPYFDLSRDPFGAYRQLKGALERALTDPPALPGAGEIRRWHDEALARLDDPGLALLLVRRAAKGLVSLIYRDTFGDSDATGTLDALAEALLRSAKLPEAAAGDLATLQIFVRDALREEVEGTGTATPEKVAPAVAALSRLGGWKFGARPAPGPEPSSSDLSRVAVSRVDARAAWPLAEDGIVAWDRAGRLRSMRGDRMPWQDHERIDIRRVTTAADGRLAIGGWGGAVRSFAGGPEPAASFRLDGTVGDLRYVQDALIAGSWKRELWRIGDDGERRELVPVQGGVHRIAVPERGDRFAVAELSGRIDFYLAGGDLHGRPQPAAGTLADIAYAGRRLVLLTDEAVAGLRVDGARSEPVPLPGAFALWPNSGHEHCLLLIRSGPPDRPAATRLLQVDEVDRHLPYLTLPAGDRLLSADATGLRLVTRRVDGCAYWRDRTQVMFWPEATAAAISGDGRRVAVCRERQVELYEDRA